MATLPPAALFFLFPADIFLLPPSFFLFIALYGAALFFLFLFTHPIIFFTALIPPLIAGCKRGKKRGDDGGRERKTVMKEREKNNPKISRDARRFSQPPYGRGGRGEGGARGFQQAGLRNAATEGQNGQLSLSNGPITWQRLFISPSHFGPESSEGRGRREPSLRLFPRAKNLPRSSALQRCRTALMSSFSSL